MAAWTVADGYTWKQALAFDGSRYVGLVSRVFAGRNFADMQPNQTFTHGLRGLVVPGQFFLVYLEEPADDFGFSVLSADVPEYYQVWNLLGGTVVASGRWTPEENFIRVPGGEPLAVVFG